MKKELGRKIISLGLAGATVLGNMYGVANAFPVLAETAQEETANTSNSDIFTEYDNKIAEDKEQIANCESIISENEKKISDVDERLVEPRKVLEEAEEAYNWGGINLLNSIVVKDTSKIQKQWDLLENSTSEVVAAEFKTRSEEVRVAQFSFDNLRYCAFLLDELNTRIQADDNVTDKEAATKKLQPDLVTWSFQSAFICSRDAATLGHALFTTSDDAIFTAMKDVCCECLTYNYKNSLTGWYDKEKAAYDAGDSTAEQGHYKILKATSDLVGFGCMENPNVYPCWCAQTGSTSWSGETFGNRSYTSDEWRKMVNEAEAPLLEAKNKAQEPVDALEKEKDTYEAAKKSAEETKAKLEKEITDLEAAKKAEAETEVVVTVTENSGEYTYDGKEKTVTGYEITSISNKNYTEDDFSYTGEDSNKTVSATDAGNYDMNLSADDFKNENSKYENVTFKIVDGSLKINKKDASITGASDSKVYNGKDQTLTKVEEEGFISGETVTGLTYKAGGKDSGEYEGEFTGEAVITNEDGKNVTDNYNLTIKTGKLTITPITDEVTVEIEIYDDSTVYDGTEHVLSDYGTSIDGRALSDDVTYTEDDYKYTGDEDDNKSSGLHAGTYTTSLSADKFENTNKNFSNVKFIVKNGTLEITKRSCTISGKQETVKYDGTRQCVSSTELTADNLADGDWFQVKWNSANIFFTEVGEYEYKYAISKLNNKKGEDVSGDYNLTLTYPKLTILPAEEEKKEVKDVTVTITPNGGEYTYDGNEKSVKGYTFSSSDSDYTEHDFSCSDDSKATVAKDAGTYKTAYTASDFTNNNEDYNVTFVIKDSVLKINPRPVTITGTSESKEYTGSEQEITDYAASGLLYGRNISGLTYSAKGTDAGEYEGKFTGDIVIKSKYYNDNNANEAKNYDITLKTGKLTITAKEDGKEDGKEEEKEDTKITEPVTVTITENSGEYTYDGTEKTVSGYTVDVDNSNVTGDTKYSESDFSYTGSEKAKTIAGTDAGEYNMNISADDFKNNNDKFTNVKFVVKDGTLKINKRDLTVTGENQSVLWSDEAQSITGIETLEGGLVDGHKLSGLTYEATGTEVGEYEGKFTGTAKVTDDNDKDVTDNYNITLTAGKLIINDNEELRKQKEEELKKAEEEAKKKAEEEAKKKAEEEAKKQAEEEAKKQAEELKAKNAKIIAKVTFSTTSYVYNGKVKTPSVTVYDKNGTKMSTAAYSVSYASGRKNLGAYTVTVKAKTGYSGSASASFMITPAKMAKPTVKAGKKKVTVKWKKLAGGSQTYQIAIKKQGASWKYYTSTGSKKTIGKLSKKKKYTVKIRAYKKINGANRYGSWSSSKTVKVK